MRRWFLAAATLAIVVSDTLACAGELRSDVDAEVAFDLDAHWGECCYYWKGAPQPSCLLADGAPVDKEAGPVQCAANQYCGVDRQACGDATSANDCHVLATPPYQCCGNRSITTLVDSDAYPSWFQPGMAFGCLPVAVDDGSGIPGEQ